MKAARMAKKGSQGALGATDSGLRPSGYPLGSRQSRAVARALLDERRKAQRKGTSIVVRFVGRTVDHDRKCTCPTLEAGTVAFCRCFL
jgi:hypothetical protein